MNIDVQRFAHKFSADGKNYKKNCKGVHFGLTQSRCSRKCIETPRHLSITLAVARRK